MTNNLEESEKDTNSFMSENDFKDKYFGYIIQLRPLEKKTSSGNQKYMAVVGREG